MPQTQYTNKEANTLLQDVNPFYTATLDLKSPAFPETSKPMMSPNSPKTELNISITSTFTNLEQHISEVFDWIGEKSPLTMLDLRHPPALRCYH